MWTNAYSPVSFLVKASNFFFLKSSSFRAESLRCFSSVASSVTGAVAIGSVFGLGTCQHEAWNLRANNSINNRNLGLPTRCQCLMDHQVPP